MIKKILLSLLLVLVLLLLYFGYDYINLINVSFVVFCVAFALLVDTVYEIRKTTQSKESNVDGRNVMMAVVFIMLFMAFGLIFRGLS